MIAGISVTCFAASYVVVLALETLRPHWRSTARTLLVYGFAAAGVFAHTLYLWHRAATSDASPLSNPYDWYLLAAWLLALLYFYGAFYYPQAAMGLFVMPLVLVLIAAAGMANDQPFAVERASRLWGNMHGSALLVGTISVMIGFMAGVMYLLQSYRLKNKTPPSEGFRLPSLERLEKINSRAIGVSVLFVGIGYFSGLILRGIMHRKELDYLPWYDPIMIAFGAMFLWLLAALVFSLVYRPAQRGRKVAYLTVASFAFLVLSFFVVLFAKSQHPFSTRNSAAAERLNSPMLVCESSNGKRGRV